jgi:hypothetical protein
MAMAGVLEFINPPTRWELKGKFGLDGCDPGVFFDGFCG